MFISKLSKTIENTFPIQIRHQHFKHDYTEFEVEMKIVFRYVLYYPSVQIFANFTIGIIGSY